MDLKLSNYWKEQSVYTPSALWHAWKYIVKLTYEA